MLVKELIPSYPENTTIDRGEIIWLNVKQKPFTLYGLCTPLDGTPYHRMPREVAKNTNAAVAELNENTSGGRVRFSTDSPYIALRSEGNSFHYFAHMSNLTRLGYDIYKDTENSSIFSGSFMPSEKYTPFYESRLFMNGSVSDFDTFTPMTNYTVNFPLYSGVTELYIGLRADAHIDFGKSYKDKAPIVFYGSSITQGACASRPGTMHAALVSRALDTDYIALGFSGAARAEDAICDYMAGLDMSVFVSDYDHNTPSVAHLESTHKKLYETIRAKHPDIPYIMLSKPDFKRNNSDDALRRKIVMDTYLYALSIGDTKVDFIDGDALFNGQFGTECTADLTHPNDAGFFRMASAILNSLSRLI